MNAHCRQAGRGLTAAAVALALAITAGCAVADAIAKTAYCQPEDPVVTPQRVAPGDELHVETTGKPDGVDCEWRMPARARYEVEIWSTMPADVPDARHDRVPLGALDPSSEGDAEGAFRVPDDFPVGEAEVSVNLQGVKTICDIDPSIGCAKNPWTPIEVVD
ncbi:hypothetical protein GCM10009809_25910 [Isoptericola hypogeus]|uniref:Secreted protein n=1 Tax=Isoptericola hypogeus TaxID=300179 RepID=A0ABN2JJ58_9MICO